MPSSRDWKQKTNPTEAKTMKQAALVITRDNSGQPHLQEKGTNVSSRQQCLKAKIPHILTFVPAIRTTATQRNTLIPSSRDWKLNERPLNARGTTMMMTTMTIMRVKV